MNPLAFVLKTLIKGYQWLISPLMPQSCRFYPNCSQYAMHAINHHGVGKGTWLAIKRIGRCHPWNEGGFDPVPGTEDRFYPMDENGHVCERDHDHNHDHHHCSHTNTQHKPARPA